MINDADDVEMCFCLNSKWRIIKERYCQLANKSLQQRLETLRDDGITDLKKTQLVTNRGNGEALKPHAKDYLMNRVHFCHNLNQVE